MIEPQIVTKTIKTVVAGQVVSLGEVEIEDPSLVLSTYEVQVVGDEPMTVELSYLGEGTITITNPNPTALSATYDSVTRTIALVNNQSEEDSDVDVNLTVSLSRPGNCVTESVTLTVHCLLILNPNLTVTPSANSTDGDDITASVSYSGGGTLSVSSDNANVTPTVSGSTITVPYYAFTDADTTVTITVSVSANGRYNAQSHSFQILYEQCQELDPQLTLTRRVLLRGVDGGGKESYIVSYLGDGTITTIELQDNEGYISYDASTKIVTIGAIDSGYYINVAVMLSASPLYAASTVTISESCAFLSHTNTYYGVPDSQLTIADPQLTVSGGGYIRTGTVSYLGNGTVTVSHGSSSWQGYNASTRTFDFSYLSDYDPDTYPITFSLSASPPYTAASVTVNFYGA